MVQMRRMLPRRFWYHTASSVLALGSTHWKKCRADSDLWWFLHEFIALPR